MLVHLIKMKIIHHTKLFIAVPGGQCSLSTTAVLKCDQKKKIMLTYEASNLFFTKLSRIEVITTIS